MKNLNEMALAFKALSHPNRLQIYVELLQLREKIIASGSDKDCSCGLTDFMSKLNIGAPTVSHHIKELVNAKLIWIERQGKFMTCHLNNEMREELEKFFSQK
ncbi:MAG: helix-turn-helix transcriptional regulator [Moraxellaceae bacterium]|jgi:ArsR family transcriptional regulator|nr:helix-turn-helix transcriptional regulator [Moraxellaceae bacterium]MBK8327069.1 helix-turn-helix transcriptional regulator [Moraxellaceae bacterium]MBL0230250.1 helix-turn-helix transcriptional regulator [Moraxellaceae bacterium]